MLRIRLRRSGKKNQAQYRIVVAEHTSPIQGKFIDRLGSYNPHSKDLVLDKEKTLDWVNKGALPSNSVARLMISAKMTHPNVRVKISPKKAPKKEAEPTKDMPDAALDAKEVVAEEQKDSATADTEVSKDTNQASEETK